MRFADHEQLLNIYANFKCNLIQTFDKVDLHMSIYVGAIATLNKM